LFDRQIEYHSRCSCFLRFGHQPGLPVRSSRHHCAPMPVITEPLRLISPSQPTSPSVTRISSTVTPRTAARMTRLSIVGMQSPFCHL